MITSEQIASTEKYALDIEDLSLFLPRQVFYSVKNERGRALFM